MGVIGVIGVICVYVTVWYRKVTVAAEKIRRRWRLPWFIGFPLILTHPAANGN